MNLIDENLEAIKTLCEKHKVEKLFAFGSVLSSSFDEESDVDFLVDFKTEQIDRYVRNYFSFKESLQTLFNREVDLIESLAISNPYFKEELEETKKLIYESKSQ